MKCLPSARRSFSRLTLPSRSRHRKVLLYRADASTTDTPRSGRHDRRSSRRQSGGSGWDESSSKFIEGSMTAFGTILIFSIAGYIYHTYYKSLILWKMENAFARGYSSLELAALGRHVPVLSDVEQANAHEDDWIPREEQKLIDNIVDGSLSGQYILLTGEKGTGKTSMLLKAMRKIDGDGVAMMEAHGDLEVFRIRLGKALDYEFHEDYIGGLFSFRGPRDSSPLLDVERAFNKMEKIALKRRNSTGKPLVLIMNGVHLLRNDQDGQNLLELIQQRAELWAASNLVTVVLNSDDYWITERLISQATRLRLISIHDIPKATVIDSLRTFRSKNFGEDVSDGDLQRVYSKIGGRLRFLTQVAKETDMFAACDSICEKEKRWLLSQCWILGQTMDDDAEDQQEFCAAALVLAKTLVDRSEENTSEKSNGRLPQIPLHLARQIMTRCDFIQQLDHINIFTINSEGMVQADSVAMQNAFRDVCGQTGFESHLKATLARLDELESLRRTREIMYKD